MNPTQQLPAGYQQGGYQQGGYQQGGYDSSQYNQYGQPPPNQYGGQPWPDGNPPEPPEPEEPGSRMWLWAIAGVAVLLVIGLVVAVFIVNSSSQETVVAPPIQPSASAATTTPRTTTSRAPAPAPAPSDTTTTETSGSATPGVTEEVVYTVTGDGKALNITYIDEGGACIVSSAGSANVCSGFRTIRCRQNPADAASARIFRAAPSYDGYRLTLSGIGTAFVLGFAALLLVGVNLALLSDRQVPGFVRALVFAISCFVVCLLLAHTLFSLAVLRLDYEKRWE